MDLSVVGREDALIVEVTMTHLPGRELSAAFYAELVRPLLDKAAPDLRHSAALLGTGSEVVGFDTERSTDHDWGPRVEVFVAPQDQHVGAGLTARIDPDVRYFHDRPFRVIGADRFAVALRASIGDSHVAGLPLIGAVDQLADNTNLLSDAGTRLRYLNGLGE